jgi:hypothetical protein
MKQLWDEEAGEFRIALGEQVGKGEQQQLHWLPPL